MLRNRATLKAAMTGAGFTINPMEWWHYDLPDAKKFPRGTSRSSNRERDR